MPIDFEITLNGVTEDVRMADMPSSLDEFVNEIKIHNVFATSSVNFGRIKSIGYQGLNRDGDDDFLTVSDVDEYDEFVAFAVDEHRVISVELIVEPVPLQAQEATQTDDEQKKAESDKTKELLEKVKKALEEDHSLAGQLKEIVHEVCGPRHHYSRGHGERGGRGRGSHRGGKGRPPFEHGSFPHSRRCHSEDDNEGPPLFPPFHRSSPAPPPHHGCFNPPTPPPHHASPLPPLSASWNVERVIHETWTPSFPPRPFGPPSSHHHRHHHHEPPHSGPGRGKFPRHSPSHPPFERGMSTHDFPPFGPSPHHSHSHPLQRAPIHHLPPRGEPARDIPGSFPRFRRSHDCCPLPPAARPEHFQAYEEEAGVEDWEVEFEELSVH